MTTATLRQASEDMLKSIRSPDIQMNYGRRSMPGAASFVVEDACIDNPALMFGRSYQTLYETNILRSESDFSEKRILIGNDEVTIYINASEQRNGCYYIVGELMAHKDDVNLQRVYTRGILTVILHEVAEPLRAALRQMKESPAQRLTALPFAHDFLKEHLSS